jgi:hypothetical protein
LKIATRLIKRVAVLARQLEMVSERSEVAVTSQPDTPASRRGWRRAEAKPMRNCASPIEELQVLTEELEVANTSLQRS